MATALDVDTGPDELANAPTVLVTADSHCGPRMVEDLRPYCPREHLDVFDAFVNDITPVRDWWRNSGMPNNLEPGHYDSAARQRDLERDGVVGEVIFHFSFNGEMIPFVPTLAHSDAPSDLALAAVGLRIYNRWLADFCNDLPGRRAGLAYIPHWDIDASVKEIEWAAENGLRGVNFPAMRENLVPYDEPVYEPLWDVCEHYDVTLTTHGGAVSPSCQTREYLAMLEAGGPMNRRAIHRLIFAGIFSRHPGLKLAMTEQPGAWQLDVMREMDAVYAKCMMPNRGGVSETSKKGRKMDPVKWDGYAVNMLPQEKLPDVPSEIFKQHVFTGGFIAQFEAATALELGYDHTMMWGSDYPHSEGSWTHPDTDLEEQSQVHRALHTTFQGLPTRAIRGMAGENAARCYGLDIEVLRKVAAHVGAPTPAQLAEPPVGPSHGVAGTGHMAFRTTTWM
ncbi:MAG: amidohydrolase family protein [Microbacteriaceae bacterium]